MTLNEMLSVILSQLAKDLKKMFTICSSVFLIFVFLTPGFADEHFPFLAQVIKESVNVRAGPNTNFEKIDKLNKGAHVVVLGRSYEWYRVQPLPTTKAYIRSDYLSALKGEGIAVVLGDNVNIRCSPNTHAASLGEVKKGTLVKVKAQANAWSSLVPVAGTAAWIHEDFLKEISADVPAALLIQAITKPPAPPAPPVAGPAAVSPWVTMRGTVEALIGPVQAPLAGQAPPGAGQAGVHYEIVLDNKSVFFLQDIPQLSFFCNTLVDVEGAIVPDPQKKLMYPLLRINKIILVL